MGACDGTSGNNGTARIVTVTIEIDFTESSVKPGDEVNVTRRWLHELAESASKASAFVTMTS